MDQRTQFMADYLRGLQTVTELAGRCGISRKTAYKWIDRYNEGGPSALPASQRRISSLASAGESGFDIGRCPGHRIIEPRLGGRGISITISGSQEQVGS